MPAITRLAIHGRKIGAQGSSLRGFRCLASAATSSANADSNCSDPLNRFGPRSLDVTVPSFSRHAGSLRSMSRAIRIQSCATASARFPRRQSRPPPRRSNTAAPSASSAAAQSPDPPNTTKAPTPTSAPARIPPGAQCAATPAAVQIAADTIARAKEVVSLSQSSAQSRQSELLPQRPFRRQTRQHESE